MLFDAGETVLLTEHGVETGNGREKGNLILTNKRIVLETTRESRRMVFVRDRQDVVILNVPLSSVLIADKKKDIIFKGHEFRINADGKQMTFKVKEPQLWINQIASAKSGNLSFNHEGTSSQPSIILQNPPPIQEGKLIKGEPVKEIIKIRCKGCQSLVNEDARFCPNCGSLM
ncbi:MAG: zinc ribbon domain-containing protein [Cuniculiplasma sp.]